MKTDIIFIALSLFILISPQRNKHIPQIYYYSIERSSFIVESANGMDQDVLTEYQLPDTCFDYDGCNVSGPGFSPSMNWFAWTFDNVAAYPSPEAKAHILNVITANQTVLLEGDGHIEQLSWSPTADVLLIERYNPVLTAKTYYVWDTNVSQEIATFTSNAIADWTADGNLIFYLPREDEERETARMLIMSPSGEILTETDVSSVWDEHLLVTCKPSVQDAMKFAYVDALGQLQITDFENNETIAIDFTDSYVYRVDWNPQEQSALIFSSKECGPVTRSTVTNLWLLLYNTQEVIRLADSAVLPFESPFLRGYNSSWSDDGNNAAYIESHAHDESLSILSISSLTVQNVYTETAQYVDMRPEQIHWLQDDRLVFYGLSATEEAVLFQYDVSKNVLDTYVSGDFVEMNYAISPNERFVAFANVSDCAGICIFNTVERDSWLISPSKAEMELGNVEALIWHPDSDWLLTTSNRIGNSYRLSVIDLANANYRTINGWFTLSPASFGWIKAN